jgi:hypothetical protein
MMSGNTRRKLLALSLLATLVAAYFSPTKQSETLLLTEHTRKAIAYKSNKAIAAPNKGAVEILAIRPRDQGNAAHTQDWFRSGQWASPTEVSPIKVESAAAVEPPLPQAPPLPFKVLGRYTDEDVESVFLQHNDENLVVHVGETIAQNYKVESLNVSTLTLRYLPLNQIQTLDLSGIN